MRASVPARIALVLITGFLLIDPAGRASAYPRPGETTRVNVGWKGQQGRSSLPTELPVYNYCCSAEISADGRFVAFSSDAANLVPGDHNEATDVFVRDLKTRRTTRVSVSSDGGESFGLCVAVQQANATEAKESAPVARGSGDPSISANGRFVEFTSCGNDLVPGDTNDAADVFVHDRWTHQTRRVSVSTSGRQTPPDVSTPQAGSRSMNCSGQISASGRFATFSSYSPVLVSGDTNELMDAYVHDLKTDRTTRVSVSSDGEEGTKGGAFEGACGPGISASGRFVAFSSGLKGLVPNDTNENSDAFVHDRRTHRTIRVSVDSAGGQADMSSHPNLPAVYGNVSISANGRFVTFDDLAPNLVPHDSNDAADVFVRDLRTDRTQRVSVTSTGEEFRVLPTEWMLAAPQSISNDGRYVGYTLAMMKYYLPPDGDPLRWLSFGDDIRPYVYDRVTGETAYIPVNSNGDRANGVSGGAFTLDGRRVLFYSEADNLVAGDTNERGDFFLRDRGAEVQAGMWHVGGRQHADAAPTPLNPPGLIATEAIGRGLAVARPSLNDLFVRIRLGSAAAEADGVAGSLDLVDIRAVSGHYVVRLSSAGELSRDATLFTLFRCNEGVCSRTAQLSGGYGTTGNEITVSVPFDALNISDASGIRWVR